MCIGGGGFKQNTLLLVTQRFRLLDDYSLLFPKEALVCLYVADRIHFIFLLITFLEMIGFRSKIKMFRKLMQMGYFFGLILRFCTVIRSHLFSL